MQENILTIREVADLLKINEKTVYKLVADAKMEQRVRRVLRKAGVNMGRIDFYHIPTDRVWTRDYGPMFVLDGGGHPLIVDWQFNGWAKYPNWQNDDAVAAQAAQKLDLPVVEPL